MAASAPILTKSAWFLFVPPVPAHGFTSGMAGWSLGKRACSIFSTNLGSHSDMARKIKREEVEREAAAANEPPPTEEPAEEVKKNRIGWFTNFTDKLTEVLKDDDIR